MGVRVQIPPGVQTSGWALVSPPDCKSGVFGLWRFNSAPLDHGPVVQLAEALDSKSRCCGFKSHQAY